MSCLPQGFFPFSVIPHAVVFTRADSLLPVAMCLDSIPSPHPLGVRSALEVLHSASRHISDDPRSWDLSRLGWPSRRCHRLCISHRFVLQGVSLSTRSTDSSSAYPLSTFLHASPSTTEAVVFVTWPRPQGVRVSKSVPNAVHIAAPCESIPS